MTKREIPDTETRMRRLWETAGFPCPYVRFVTRGVPYHLDRDKEFLDWCECWGTYNALARTDEAKAERIVTQYGGIDYALRHNLKELADKLREAMSCRV